MLLREAGCESPLRPICISANRLQARSSRCCRRLRQMPTCSWSPGTSRITEPSTRPARSQRNCRRRCGFRSSPCWETTTSKSGAEQEIHQILVDHGVCVLDGDTCEVQGVGFAGVKGFAGGFGRRALGPWGEPIIKQFVHEAVNEALKLESALARLRTDKKIVLSALCADRGNRGRGAARDLSVPRLQPSRRAAGTLQRDRCPSWPRA